MSAEVENNFSDSLAVEFAERLCEAELRVSPIPALSLQFPKLSRDQAYQIQRLTKAARLAPEKGKKVMLAGYKIGLTSREAQRQFGVFEPDYGYLVNEMQVEPDGEISLSELIHPRIEGEIAFLLGKDLRGPGLTLADLDRAVEAVAAALEIVDCRYDQWRVTGADLVADNAASSRFVLGKRLLSPANLDLAHLGMAFLRDDQVRLTGAGAATMGDPRNAVLFLANGLGDKGEMIPAGSVILSGALSAMLSFEVGHRYTCEIAELGSVAVRAVPHKEKG